MAVNSDARLSAGNESAAFAATPVDAPELEEAALASIQRIVDWETSSEAYALMRDHDKGTLLNLPDRASCDAGGHSLVQSLAEALKLGRCYVLAYRNSASINRDYAKAFKHDAELEQIDAAIARLSEAGDALRPFAGFANAINDSVPDDIEIGFFADGAMRFSAEPVTVAHLKMARTALGDSQ